MHYDILDKKRKEILPLLSKFKDNFYLAGGTALALHLGHRDSIDFDFFTADEFDVDKLLQNVERVFSEHKVRAVQEEEDTLSVVIDNEIRLSFFRYPYRLIEPLIEESHLKIASIADIGAMKLAAVVSRATMKDYFDIFYILDKFSLAQLISICKKKLPSLDENLIRKSLVYFDDVPQEKLNFKTNNPPSWDDIKNRIKKEVLQ